MDLFSFGGEEDITFSRPLKKIRPVSELISHMQCRCLLSQGFLDSSVPSLPNPVSRLDASVRSAVDAYIRGDYFSILQGNFGRILFSAISVEERLDLGVLATPTSLQLVSRILARRSYLYIYKRRKHDNNHEVDNEEEEEDEFTDAEGSIDTPEHRRALGLILAALSALNIFVRANFTGPELSAPERVICGDIIALGPNLVSAAEAEARNNNQSTGCVAASNAALEEALKMLHSYADTDKIESKMEGDDELSTSLNKAIMSSTSASTDTNINSPSPPVSAASFSIGDGTISFSPLHLASLELLRVESDEAYELLQQPQLLVAARAAFTALCPKMPFASNSSSSSFSFEQMGVLAPEEADSAHLVDSGEWSVSDSRMRTLRSLVSTLFLATWGAGRTATIHQRSLVDRQPSRALWLESRQHFINASLHVVPNLPKTAFSVNDHFDETLERELLNLKSKGWLSVDNKLYPDYSDLEQKGVFSSIRIRFLLEWGLTQHFFNHDASARASYHMAKAESGFQLELTGVLGKRTKYQSFLISQLVVKASSSSSTSVVKASSSSSTSVVKASSSSSTSNTTALEGEERERGGGETSMSNIDKSKSESIDHSSSDILKSDEERRSEESHLPVSDFSNLGTRVLGGVREIALGDVDKDTILMEGMTLESETSSSSSSSFSSSSSVKDGDLTVIDQCIVLAMCCDIKFNNASDSLTWEHMRPFITKTLESPQHWLVHSTALLLRSMIEVDGYRTAERAVLQMQALVDQHSNRLTASQRSRDDLEKAAPASVRLAFFFSLPWPSHWGLSRLCADSYRKMGALRAALQLYDDLCLWEDIVSCHVALDRVRRAERLVRARLRVAPTPALWCVLGDVTDKDLPFEAARVLSGGRCSRADLALGQRKMRRGDVEGCIEAFKRGLRSAPGSSKDWFNLGAVSMRIGRFPLALESFSRVVALDPSRSDAWANLGGIYLRQKHWLRSYSAYEQAIKADRKDHRIWSSFLVACIKTRNYSRAISVQRTLVTLFMRFGEGSSGDDGGEGVDEECLHALCSAVLQSAINDESDSSSSIAQSNGKTHVPDVSTSSSDNTDVFPEAPVSLNIIDDDTDNKDFDSMPTTSTSSSSSLSTTASTSVNSGTPSYDEVLIDADGNPAYVHLERLSSLLTFITNSIPVTALVWDLCSAVAAQRKDTREVLECRLRQCRAIQRPVGWEKDESAISSLAKAASFATDCYINFQEVPLAIALLEPIIARIDAGEGLCSKGEGRNFLGEILNGLKRLI
jgi:tetratricopeptide (TPR) repeat protein